MHISAGSQRPKKGGCSVECSLKQMQFKMHSPPAALVAPRDGVMKKNMTYCLPISPLLLVMLGRGEKKQSDHGENLQPAALLLLGDNKVDLLRAMYCLAGSSVGSQGCHGTRCGVSFWWYQGKSPPVLGGD
jgi:hypothetical protein